MDTMLFVSLFLNRSDTSLSFVWCQSNLVGFLPTVSYVWRSQRSRLSGRSNQSKRAKDIVHIGSHLHCASHSTPSPSRSTLTTDITNEIIAWVVQWNWYEIHRWLHWASSFFVYWFLSFKTPWVGSFKSTLFVLEWSSTPMSTTASFRRRFSMPTLCTLEWICCLPLPLEICSKSNLGPWVWLWQYSGRRLFLVVFILALQSWRIIFWIMTSGCTTMRWDFQVFCSTCPFWNAVYHPSSHGVCLGWSMFPRPCILGLCLLYCNYSSRI